MNIGAVSKKSGVSQRMIRHYEGISLIPVPPRRDSGYRDYGEDDVHRLRFIANARDLGFGIEEIRTLLALWSDRERSSADVKRLALQQAEALGEKMKAIEAMRSTLIHLAKGCHGDSRPDCPIIDALAAKMS
ncbi:Cu(I)-responsive transcriptional regulator [Sphingosinicella microcystinivorans]|uniref:Cu(I)-responsive transcriptional regulator n=1 Tax=Sphingosinicella microcystinivorans TaxID=335406 RepID=A0AAD1D6C8_SPHMI|nr:Cu(I)-responsive transcriptional regulator [Sphingosinicella microcystinivorans]RKS90717.1 MerR family transcriptional regulator [Sphingosinicella microcystinivorans]BBE33631.1 Cu(I)-responsive transcriptional regulator [Sphingosinicella microcystinivorans]